jgi:hypothetical protein
MLLQNKNEALEKRAENISIAFNFVNSSSSAKFANRRHVVFKGFTVNKTY